MDKNDYLRAFRSEADDFLTAAGRGLKARVPSCPAWAVGDLLVHLGGVYAFVAAIGRERAIDRADVKLVNDAVEETNATLRNDPEFARSPRALDWFRESADRLEAVLRDLDPAQPVWTLSPQYQTGGFWHRRMAQETAVHRWDAEAAHGTARPIETSLAVDGIEETAVVLIPRRRRASKTAGQGETYLIRPTDADGVWRVRFDGDQVTVERSAGSADVTLSGPASDLLLFLWQRVPRDRIKVEGDPAKLDRYFELAPPN
ncbi:MAG TPA: maleylpyruvate isomerase family mycothiol-dependent enzyme [Dehalococcoidia bacterium]|nr:maleylpyruvate isomerase family mycothiol-dependent enzyme [Dehalococcoidia bacterium]